MPQSLSKVAIHIVFSTKKRQRFLKDGTLRDELYAYMSKILCDNVDTPAVLLRRHSIRLRSNEPGIQAVPSQSPGPPNLQG